MKPIWLTLTFLSFFAIGALSQEETSSQKQPTNSKKAIEIIQSCDCREIVMINSRIEKKYTREWLEQVNIEDNFITFSKGEYTHRWNAEKIFFIEQGNGYYRFYIE